MYKIGCIGHAGRHGEFLSRIFNREKRFDGYRFSYVFGEDEELTLEQKDERFYQVDPARSGESSGLGLSMVRWIVQAHGGTIQAESALGEGSTFTARLPLGGPEGK